MLLILLFMAGFISGVKSVEPQIIETIKIVNTTVYRYPNTPPYENLPDPINLNQALALLDGMRASHIAALNWTFESSPGFGIDDREFQKQCIEWYDQLIDFVLRQSNE